MYIDLKRIYDFTWDHFRNVKLYSSHVIQVKINRLTLVSLIEAFILESLMPYTLKTVRIEPNTPGKQKLVQEKGCSTYLNFT